MELSAALTLPIFHSPPGMEGEMPEGQKPLGVCVWCGIVAVVIGAAALFVELWFGVAVLVLGGAWFAYSVYRDYQTP